jgi:aralkylamine N-acetyltransferase
MQPAARIDSSPADSLYCPQDVWKWRTQGVGDEQGQRLASADCEAGEAFGEILYRMDRDVDPAAVAAVYRSVGWTHLGSDAQLLGEALRACAEVATAWEVDECVGVARLLSDLHFHGLILGVAVRPDRQGRGIGTALVERLMSTNPDMSYHLWTHSHRFSFYGRLGFKPDETAMERPRLDS